MRERWKRKEAWNVKYIMNTTLEYFSMNATFEYTHTQGERNKKIYKNLAGKN